MVRIMKKKLRDQAILLRKQGQSLDEISAKLSVAQSTVSLWVRDLILDDGAKLLLKEKLRRGRLKGIEVNRKKRLRWMSERSDDAKRTLQNMPVTRDSAKLSCALLHWCEGNKETSAVLFTNSDPVMISTFLALLRTAFSIDEQKLRVCMHIHGYHDEIKQKEFWSRITKIPLKQFIKTFHKKNTGKSKKVGYQGCVSIRYYDSSVATELNLLWKLFGNKWARR